MILRYRSILDGYNVYPGSPHVFSPIGYVWQAERRVWFGYRDWRTSSGSPLVTGTTRGECAEKLVRGLDL